MTTSVSTGEVIEFVSTLKACASMRLYDIKFRTHDETSKDEKQHNTVEKSTSKQQICISDGSRFRCAKNLTHTPSASGSYGRLAGRPADESLVVLKKI